MTYMKVQQAAEACGLSVRQVQVYCNRGRVPGAQKFGIAWQIPEGTPKPEDARYKTAHTQRENSSLGDHSPRIPDAPDEHSFQAGAVPVSCVQGWQFAG